MLTAERLLAVVGELGQASLGLVAWELSLAEEEVRPAWDDLVARGVLEPGPVDIHTGERMYGVRSGGTA